MWSGGGGDHYYIPSNILVINYDVNNELVIFRASQSLEDFYYVEAGASGST